MNKVDSAQRSHLYFLPDLFALKDPCIKSQESRFLGPRAIIFLRVLACRNLVSVTKHFQFRRVKSYFPKILHCGKNSILFPGP